MSQSDSPITFHCLQKMCSTLIGVATKLLPNFFILDFFLFWSYATYADS